MQDWKPILWDFLQSKKMQDLKERVLQEMKAGKIIYPQPKQWLEAFNKCSFKNTKVIIIGQDPYHGPGQAHGLSFSVEKGVKTPPSLLNILKEAQKDLGWDKLPSHGCLSSWAEQGVLLLNNCLTVEEGKAGSHRGWGWEDLTDYTIKYLNDHKRNLVFILWGSHAQEKIKIISKHKHLVIKSVHPSPLSAHRGFFGSKPFSKCNEYLIDYGYEPINWMLP